MFRLLLIPLAGSALPSWPLQGFQVEQAASEEDGLQRLTHQVPDAVLVVSRGGEGSATGLCERLEAVCGTDIVPLLFAADGRDPASSEPLLTLSFDAFVDLEWDPLVVERCLSLAIHRVRSDRGVAEIQRQVLRAVREEVAQLKDQSIRDELTGLFNPRYLREVLAREHERCQRHGRPYALVYFDVDDYAQLTSRHGSAVGARALGRVAVALSATLRKSDYAFRIGSEEFAVLLIGASRQDAQAYAERISGALRHCQLTADTQRLPLTLSTGIALFPNDGDTVDGLLNSADLALRRARAAERETVVAYSDLAPGGGAV